MDKQAAIEPNERANMEGWLTITTGWNEKIFRNMTDEELRKIWKERVEDR